MKEKGAFPWQEKEATPFPWPTSWSQEDRQAAERSAIFRAGPWAASPAEASPVAASSVED